VVFLLGKRLFGVAEGLVAAGWAAVYRPFLFFEGQLLAAWLATLLAALFLLLLWGAVQRPHARTWLAAGLLLGLGAVVRGNLLLVVPIGLVWIVLAARRERAVARPAAIWAVAFLLGVLAPIVPTVVHNYLAEGDFVPITSTGGVNLYTGNGDVADGFTAIPVHSRWEAAMDAAHAAAGEKSSALSAYWTRRAIDYAIAHPGAVAALFVKKLVLFWDGFEYPNNVSFDFYKKLSVIMRAPLPGFGLLGTLALAGFVVLRRWSPRAVGFLALFVLFYMMSVALFFACDRFRLPAIPALLTLGSAMLVWLVRRVRERAWREVGVALVPLVLAAAFVNIDLYGARPEHLSRDYLSLGDALRYGNRLPDAVRAYREAIRQDPADPDPWAQLGGSLLRIGQREEAERSFREAIQLSPDYALPRVLLVRMLFARGSLDESIEHLRHLVGLYPANPEPRVMLGRCYLLQGHLDDAEREFLAALEADPALSEAARGLEEVRRRKAAG
jgi:hypothetical protein